MAPPRVSILLPVKDAQGTIAQAVESVLRQTVNALELVVVDDGSTDDTPRILAQLACTDPRITVARGEGAGLCAALQRGLTLCTAPFVARMDGDDEAFPERLERSLAALEANPALWAVGTQVEIFREDIPPSPNMQAYARWLNGLTTPEALFRDRLVESPLCHPSVTLRRQALQSLGGYRDGPFPEDYDLWLRILDAGGKLKAVDVVLLRWRDHHRRLTRTDPRYGPDGFTRAKAESLLRSVLADRPPVSIWGTGPQATAMAQALLREGVRIERYLDVTPKKIGQKIHGIPVCDFRELQRPGPEHLLAAVAAKGAREEIRGYLAQRGFVEGEHFTVIA